MEENVDKASKSDLVRLSIVYSAIEIDGRINMFEKIEAKVKDRFDEFNLAEICILAEAFGFEYGSDEFIQMLEKRVTNELPELEYEQILLVLRGFLFTYRDSKNIFNTIKSRLTAFFPRMDISTISMIAKAYHIVIIGLKKLDQVTPDQLFDVASNYSVTRTGSRELYKILEFVIREKMDDIAKNPEIARGLYYLYTTSGLCSPELIKKLQFIV